MKILKPKEEWYEKYSKLEEEVSAGSFFLNTNKNDVTNKIAPMIEDKEKVIRVSFGILMHKLRLSKNLKLEQLANKVDVELAELFNIENESEYKPSLRTINQLAKYYDLPYKILAQIAGVVKNPDKNLANDMIRYAANSSSFEKLTKEEKIQLNDIIKVIKEHENQ